MLKLYSHELSGNCYKARLLLSLLNLEHEVIQVDLTAGEHKSPEYLKLNSFGQVPVLVDEEMVLPDSQAILVYLARRYGDDNWLPVDAEPLSRVVRWLSTTAGEIQQGLGAARRYYLFGEKNINIEVATQKAENILKILNDHLSDRQWLELDRPTIADVAAFPYVALAPDGKIDLASYPNVVAWIERIKNLSGFIGMTGIEARTPAAI